MIKVKNDGKEIIETNYWQTEHNQKGLFYCSINAGAFRLLVDNLTNAEMTIPMLEAARNAKEIVISRGFWIEQNKKDCFEFMFDDDPDTPFMICLCPDQLDRIPLESDEGREFDIIIYDGDEKVFEGKCRYRRVKRLPCLKPFAETGPRE